MKRPLLPLHLPKFLFVGLGNPGKKYEKTRHNAGRLVLEELKKNPEIGERAVEFFTPQCFMNECGAPILMRARQAGIETKDIIILHDDLDIPAGEFRLQFGRSSAGHKGVQSVIDALGTADFWRVRIGIGRPPMGEDAERFVLKSIPARELEKISKLAESDNFIQKIIEILDGEANE